MCFIFSELNDSESIDEISYKRAKHVINEIERTLKAAKALKNGSLDEFGCLMNESHDSLRLKKRTFC